MVDLLNLKEEVRKQLALSKQESASLERVLASLNNINSPTPSKKRSAATRRKISIAMKKSHAARTTSK